MANRLTTAMEEAYASAPSHVVFLHTLELSHPTWGAPIRIVLGDEGDENGLVWLTLENGVQTAFTAMAFDAVPPGFDEDGPTEGKIIVDGVSGEMIPFLEGAVGVAGTISVVYRNYRSDARFEPGEVISGMQMKNVSVTSTRVEGTIGFDDVGSQAFPRVTYDIETYPGLYQS